MRKFICRLVCVLFVLSAGETLRAQGTAFMYQGQLDAGGSPATGNYDLRFQVYDAVTNGNAISVPLTNAATAVNNGLFTATLDFGAGLFTGTNYWLQIGVRTNGDTNAFALLSPRQPILPVPYAIFANSASNLLGTLASTQLSGTLPASAFAGYTNTVALTNGANLFAGTFGGTFSGNGAGLASLNASQLASGTVADARLSTNVALLNASQTYSGVNVFTNFGNSFRGSFFGNGLVGWLVQTGTTVQAVIDTGYVLTNSQLVTVTLPQSPNIGDIVRISGAGPGGWKLAQNTNQSVIGSFSGYGSSYWLASGASSSAWISLASSANGIRLAGAVNATSQIYVSGDSGQTWSGSGSASAVWRSVAMSADGTRLVAGQGSVSQNGLIYFTTNSGSSWIGASGEPSAKWYAIAMSANGSNAVAVANGTGIYTSANGGANWSLSTNSAQSWQSVASSANGSNLVAVINGGRIYTSANAGSSWGQQSGAPSANWIGVASSSDGSRLVAVANPGGIYTSSDFGVTWTPTSAPSTNWECVASSADGGRLTAAVFGGGIYSSANFGVTWNRQASAPMQNWVAISSSADGSKLAAAVNGGTIYYLSSLPQPSTTTGTNGCLSGAQGSAVELQYIGNGRFMPVSLAGTIWAN